MAVLPKGGSSGGGRVSPPPLPQGGERKERGEGGRGTPKYIDREDTSKEKTFIEIERDAGVWRDSQESSFQQNVCNQAQMDTHIKRWRPYSTLLIDTGRDSEWTFCGTQVSHTALFFLCQVIILYISIIPCFVNLSIGNGPNKLWIGILSLSIGTILPSPKVRMTLHSISSSHHSDSASPTQSTE